MGELFFLIKLCHNIKCHASPSTYVQDSLDHHLCDVTSILNVLDVNATIVRSELAWFKNAALLRVCSSTIFCMV